MLFVVIPKFCISIVFSFAWGYFNSQEKLKTMLMQNCGVTNKEHYGVFWYFLEWSIRRRVGFIYSGNSEKQKLFGGIFDMAWVICLGEHRVGQGGVLSQVHEQQFLCFTGQKTNIFTFSRFSKIEVVQNVKCVMLFSFCETEYFSYI